MKLVNVLCSLALVAAVASVSCGGGAAKKARIETPAPAATSTPARGGPILVYTNETPLDKRVGHVETFVHAYDVAVGREILRATIAQSSIVPVFNRASGDVFYSGQFKDGQEIHAVSALTGVDRLVYRPDRPMESPFVISPDGGSMAVSELESEEQTSHTYVMVVSIADGSTRTLATFGSQFSDDFRGRPAPMVWRDDGRGILVAGDTSSGASGTWATVMLDGTVRVHLTDGAFPSPNGRFLELDDTGENCVAVGAQRVRLVDLDTNMEVARTEDSGRGIRNQGWSPNEDALLYSQFTPIPGTENDPCRPTYDASSGRSFLLRTSGGPPEPVADVAALRAQWQPEARIELTCVNGPANAFDSCPGVDRRQLSVNGAVVGVAESIRIVGFIDRASP